MHMLPDFNSTWHMVYANHMLKNSFITNLDNFFQAFRNVHIQNKLKHELIMMCLFSIESIMIIIVEAVVLLY